MAQVVVIGAGLMGAASTMTLSQRGHEVVTFEARHPGHRAGSSHGSSRIVRRSYAQPYFVGMTGRALELWRSLEQACGTQLLTITGGLDHGARANASGMFTAMRRAGVSCELMASDAAAERWPHMRFEGDVLYHGEAGVVDPELAISEMLRLARRLGARVEHGTPVVGIETSAGRTLVRTPTETLKAQTVVVAVGPWLPQLLGGLVALPPLKVTQQQVFYFARRDDGDAGTWPVVGFDGGLSAYALPGGRDGMFEGNMKIGDHTAGRVTTADDRDNRIDPEGRRRVVGHVHRWWPGLDPDPVAESTCLYTWTTDEDFIIDRVGSLVVCSPCSGHGAKFSPLIGEWVTDLVENKPTPCPRFGLSRRKTGHRLS